jgi:bifunctional DNase/RNase
MVLMRIRELTRCAKHQRVLITLDDVESARHVTFYADAEDARRLARELRSSPRVCHPIFDFIQELLRRWHAAPVRVVLENVNGDGIGATVYLRQGELEAGISCYPPDALALALRTGVPIYATPDVLSHSGACPPLRDHEMARWLERVQPQDFEA